MWGRPDQSSRTAPTTEPINEVPAVTAKRSQPGRIADDIAAEELVALAPVGVAPLEAEEAPEPVLALLVIMLALVVVAPLPIVVRVVQEDEGGSG